MRRPKNSGKLKAAQYQSCASRLCISSAFSCQLNNRCLHHSSAMFQPINSLTQSLKCLLTPKAIIKSILPRYKKLVKFQDIHKKEQKQSM